MSKTKQKSRAAKKTAVFFIVFIIIEMLVLGGISYVFRNDDVTPSAFGYSFFIMNSDKMTSNDSHSIPKDVLTVFEEETPGKDKVGKPVLCENVPDVGTTVMWLDSVEATSDNNGLEYTVSQNDGIEYKLKAKNVLGTHIVYYKTAGKIINFVSDPKGLAACAAVPVALLILIEIIIAIATHSGKKKNVEETNDDDDEQMTIDDVLFGKDDASPLQLDDQKDSKKEIEDISFADDNDETDEEEYAEENPDEESEETGEAEVEDEPEVPQPVVHKNVDETVSTTRKAASDSLEELMKMMEDEQNRLKDQLKKD